MAERWPQHSPKIRRRRPRPPPILSKGAEGASRPSRRSTPLPSGRPTLRTLHAGRRVESSCHTAPDGCHAQRSTSESTDTRLGSKPSADQVWEQWPAPRLSLELFYETGRIAPRRKSKSFQDLGNPRCSLLRARLCSDRCKRHLARECPHRGSFVPRLRPSPPGASLFLRLPFCV